jgi:hypothetical protein
MRILHMLQPDLPRRVAGRTGERSATGKGAVLLDGELFTVLSRTVSDAPEAVNTATSVGGECRVCAQALSVAPFADKVVRFRPLRGDGQPLKGRLFGAL